MDVLKKIDIILEASIQKYGEFKLGDQIRIKVRDKNDRYHKGIITNFYGKNRAGDWIVGVTFPGLEEEPWKTTEIEKV